MDEIVERKRIESTAHGVSVSIEREFEHHMGASTVYLKCDPPLLGVSTFQTTNGNALLCGAGEWMLLWDRSVLLLWRLATGEVWHYQTPKMRSFFSIRADERYLHYILNDIGGRQEEQPSLLLEDIPAIFAPGLGPVVDGRFPSACDL